MESIISDMNSKDFSVKDPASLDLWGSAASFELRGSSVPRNGGLSASFGLKLRGSSVLSMGGAKVFNAKAQRTGSGPSFVSPEAYRRKEEDEERELKRAREQAQKKSSWRRQHEAWKTFGDGKLKVPFEICKCVSRWTRGRGSPAHPEVGSFRHDHVPPLRALLQSRSRGETHTDLRQCGEPAQAAAFTGAGSGLTCQAGPSGKLTVCY
eukprot:s434_g25.t1